MLGKKFFERPTEKVAKDLLGKFLVRRINQREIVLMITEVEAYDGFNDKASHASRGKTKRNEPMFGEAGRWYVYFTYGMHWMLNIVTRERDYPAAVLIRAVSAIDSSGELKAVLSGPARQNFYKSKNLDGPAKLTKFLRINKKLNGLVATRKSGLWLEDRNRIKNSYFIKAAKGVHELRIKRGARVGVGYAGLYWARRKWRFYIAK